MESLFPRDQASVMPKITAPVQKFYVNRGDHVKQGQLLAVLENRDLTAAAAEAKGALAQAESNLRTTQGAVVPEAVVKAQTDVDAARQARDAAKKVLDSREQLFEEGALARRQVDESAGGLRAGQQRLPGRAGASASAASGVQRGADQDRRRAGGVGASASRIPGGPGGLFANPSPISGIVADRPLYAGDMATHGHPAAHDHGHSRVVARVNVPQEQARAVRVGQPAAVSLTDGGEPETGRVTVVSPATDPNSTTLQVWVEIDNPGERLKPGASVHADIITEIVQGCDRGARRPPYFPERKAALRFSPSAPTRPRTRRRSRLGVREGDKVQILSGVVPGEEVVVVGGMGVDDKAKVKIVNTTVKEAPDEEDENAPPEEGKGQNQKKDEAKPKAK